MSQLELFGSSPAGTLFVDINGKHVRLDDCHWVLWGPCGCPFGITVGALSDLSLVHATEDSAWHSLYETDEEIEQARQQGQRMELITGDRLDREVWEPMKARCTHGSAA